MTSDPITSNFTTDDTPVVVTTSPLQLGILITTVSACFAYGLGFVGNVLSLIVFCTQDEFRKISTGLLFMLITISNFIHLWTLASDYLTVYNYALYPNNYMQCRYSYYIQNISRAMSTYWMVTVALDRLIRTEYPMRSKKICTKHNVIIISIIYFIIFAAFWSFYLIPVGNLRFISGSCSFTQSQSLAYFSNTVYLPMRAVLVCLIPVMLMISANIRMILNIRQSRRRVTNATTVPSSDMNMPVPNISSSTGTHTRRMSALDRMLFYMMLANAITFITTQVPYHLFLCVKGSVKGLDSNTSTFIRAVLLIWSSVYFGIAFYFYCLASPLFRQKFIKMLKKAICLQRISESITNRSKSIR
ncbi:unnamed protein product [Adineta steineri]|uniref:G-protein coupled receptors family 1 profile domain-containing protein n=1 Tax=Adineta steineri TaxID=433720 RepID=A0A816EY40_9BILA|nr:unnamed protein product [Adineta steineri]CAF1536039.1 unnamed protein product [Adineta steineri]CAF1655556.1 unnamed protein product [Adineta steineri]CAF1655571.1 unnamed protein product [Adineta steineri]